MQFSLFNGVRRVASRDGSLEVESEKGRDRYSVVVNTTGPYSMPILKASGIEDFPLAPTAGSMVVYGGRYVNSVINRMREPSDGGDIVLPYGEVSVVGTIATVIEDPDNFKVHEEDVAMMLDEAKRMVPVIGAMQYKRIYSSVRPLIRSSDDPRKATRSFAIIDHGTSGLPPGFLSVLGGKFTTGRLVGYEAARHASEYSGFHVKDVEFDFNTTYERFLSFRGGGDRAVDSLLLHFGSTDQERLMPALAFLLSRRLMD
ncbi:FAD-dependent oxidoreductase [Thermogymnomonas acidicola]|uniref:FAD-dependent oxidoreductase n=1 Tax=Thermogymnomonas acidicola TaxID=399579 RepID=UPI0014942E30|nr:FAD-dependent oxidoreductase [Thermogymnomonas acidicola]